MNWAGSSDMLHLLFKGRGTGRCQWGGGVPLSSEDFIWGLRSCPGETTKCNDENIEEEEASEHANPSPLGGGFASPRCTVNQGNLQVFVLSLPSG